LTKIQGRKERFLTKIQGGKWLFLVKIQGENYLVIRYESSAIMVTIAITGTIYAQADGASV